MNNHCYPRIHYPEVYVLEGGYCQYFKEAATRCVPQAYVRMDDPVHAVSRKEDLDQFRRGKFGRTKSYAYGDVPGAGAAKLLSAAANKRAAAPAGPPAVFAAANAARTRRPQKSQDLAALTEDGDMTAGEEDETDIGDSPCPPPTKTGGLNFKVKKVGRAPLMRAETCGPLRLAF
jgi:M-phase inducer tyrosine phosphatase